MAEVSYLKLKNTTTGEDVKGSCEEIDFKSWIEVLGLNHEITHPTHPQTEKITGELMHGPLTIIKPMDSASPVLQAGLIEGHHWEGEIKFVQTAAKGKKERWYTISFKKATLMKIKTYKPNALETERHLPDMEEIDFRYEILQWRHEIAGKEATYDWNRKPSPVMYSLEKISHKI